MSTSKNVDMPVDKAETPQDIIGRQSVVNSPAIIEPPAAVKLPAVIPPVKEMPHKQRWLKPGLLLLVVLLAATGGAYWWLHPHPGLPPGIASGNGRLEADEIDIDTKFAGRIANLFADEGDLTKAGEILAKMDTRDVEAQLKQSQALILQAQEALNAANATLDQQKSLVLYAQQEIARTQALVGKGFATKEQLDSRTQLLAGAIAGERAAEDTVRGSQDALDAATHAAEIYQANIADDSLVSPRDGRIEYRIANVGEVLPAGGKVFTILDTAYVYMDIYLPTESAGRVKLGSDARIVLDSYPTRAFPAKVVFVAAQAQFTPKTVETQAERDVLMFRVRVRIDPELLLAHAADVRSGLPGMAYVQTDPKVAWPVTLQGDASK